MNMKDEIIEQVWQAKDKLAALHNYDVRRLAKYLRAKEQSSGHAILDLHAREMKRRTMPPTVP
jgi:hypothetical protein